MLGGFDFESGLARLSGEGSATYNADAGAILAAAGCFPRPSGPPGAAIPAPTGPTQSPAPTTTTGLAARLQCAANFAEGWSIAGIMGWTNSVAQGALGNVFSAMVYAYDDFQSNPVALYGDMLGGGLGQGLPIGSSFAVREAYGALTGAALGAVTQSRPLVDLGLEEGAAALTGATVDLANPVLWGKTLLDLATFAGGYLFACAP